MNINKYKNTRNEYTNNNELLESDINIFVERIGISREKFTQIIQNGFQRDHKEFKNFQNKLLFCQKIKHILKK